MSDESLRYILFSPIGLTDPICEDYDGPFLHIARYYQPEIAYIFLTDEMAKRHMETDYYVRYARYAAKDMKVEPIETDISKAHDFDIYLKRFRDELARIQSAHPGYTLLLNVTSGTPQMQNALCVLRITELTNVICVQVSHPHKSSGSGHDKKKKYLDPNEPEDQVVAKWIDQNMTENVAVNRCAELDLPSHTGAILRKTVKSQLDGQDYYGAYQMISQQNSKRFFADKAVNAVYGAHLRSQNLLYESKKYFGMAGIEPVKVYDYWDIVEYYLSMKWRCNRGEFSVFILSLTSLSDMLYRIALKKQNFDVEKTYNDKKGYIKANVIKNLYPKVYDTVIKPGSHKVTYWNSDAYYKALKCYIEEPSEILADFKWIREMEVALRNKIAHKGYAVDEAIIEKAVNCKPSEIIERLESIIFKITGVQKVQFEAYERQRDMLIELIDAAE